MKNLIFISLLTLSLTINAQFDFSFRGTTLDTLYFPYSNDVQLIVINNLDSWNAEVAFVDMMYPRGGSHADVIGPPPRNTYIFRNKEGKITKVYNNAFEVGNQLKGTDYINTNDSTLLTIIDYTQLNKHLKFYSDSNKVGLIDLEGNIVAPAIYDDIRKYQDPKGKWDKLVIRQNGFFGLLDSNLNVVVKPIYNAPSHYPEHGVLNGCISVVKDGKRGLINENGDVLIDFKYDNIRLLHDTIYAGYVHKENLPKSRDYGDKVISCILYNKNFKVITAFEDYDYIKYWGIKSFIVKKDNKCGVLNHKGDTIIPVEYNIISPYKGAYCAWKDQKAGMIDYEGNMLLPVEFDGVFIYGAAVYVTQNKLIGVYNRQYELVAEPQYQRKHWDMGKYILTTEDGKEGFVKHQKEGSYYQSPEGKITKL